MKNKIIIVDYSNDVGGKERFYFVDICPEEMLLNLKFKRTADNCWERSGALSVGPMWMRVGNFKASIVTPKDASEAYFH